MNRLLTIKNLKPLIFLALVFAPFSFTALAQELTVKIKIISTNQINVEGSFKDEITSSRNWSFLQDYADVSNLADRIENLQLVDNKGEKVELKKFNAGEYLASRNPISFKYQVNLTPSKKITDAAHTSWLTETRGLLMLADLLPNIKSKNILIDFDLPKDWKILSSETLLSENAFNLKNVENAVFLVGKNLREKQFQIDKTTLSFAFAGDWKFSDDEALEMASSILAEHKNIFKEIAASKVQIVLSPFPQENSNPDRWRAETRGSTITIISGALPHKSQAIQRLHEQLRHETFHLWLPNSLALSGNYDWFYEGFTIYHALRTGVELNQIRFEDFLNTLGKAYDLSEDQVIPLIEASNKRWTGSGNFIYAKGLVVAFLCDIALLQSSKGRRNLKDVFRQLYQKHRIPNQIEDGNLAVTRILKGFPELISIIQNYIEGKSKINWENDLALFGIVPEKSNFGVQLKVMSNLNGRQKDLLDKLGYNQWRKILQKTK